MAEYIERDSVLYLIGEHQKSLCPLGLLGRRFYNDKNAYDEWQVVSDEIDSIPAADVAPVVHGRWRWAGECGFNDCYICSECGKIAMNDSNYCPNCGAKMDKEEV